MCRYLRVRPLHIMHRECVSLPSNEFSARRCITPDCICSGVCVYVVLRPSRADYWACCERWWHHRMTSSSHGSADKWHTRLRQRSDGGQTQIASRAGDGQTQLGRQEVECGDREAGLGRRLSSAALWQRSDSECEKRGHTDLESVPVAPWLILVFETRQVWDSTVAPSYAALRLNSTFWSSWEDAQNGP